MTNKFDTFTTVFELINLLIYDLIQKIDLNRATSTDFEIIKDILISGGVVLYPTDTVIGLGCIVSSESAVTKINKIKQRDLSQPLSFAFSDINMLEDYVIMNNQQRHLVKKLLPGPITIIFPKKNESPICYGYNIEKQTMGCRIIDDSKIKKLISLINEPLITTSANITGTKPVNSIGRVTENILKSVNLIIDWNIQISATPSTILEFDNAGITVIREGVISTQRIKKIWEEIDIEFN